MKLHFNKSLKKYIQTVGKHGPIDDALFIPLLFKKLICIQFLEPKWSFRRYAIFYLFLTLLYIYAFIGMITAMRDNPTPLFLGEALYCLCPLMTTPPKVYLFANYGNIFCDLYVIVKSYMFPQIKNDSKEKSKIFLRNLKFVGICFTLIALTNMSVFFVSSIYCYLIIHRPYVYPVYTLMPMVTPFAQLAFFLHNTYCTSQSIHVMVLDMWFVVFIYSFCAVSDTLVNVLLVKKDKTVIEYQEKLQQALRNFYKGHQLCNDYLLKLSKVYRVLALVPLINATFSMCIVLFASTNEINSKILVQFFPVLMEVFAYNWCGEWIKTKVNKLRLTLMYFDWVNLQAKDKKSYYIMTLYFSKDIGIKLMNGTELSLILMTSILKISYQAFTVMRQMK